MAKKRTIVTPKNRWVEKALKALATGATVSEAATAAKVDRRAIYHRVKSDKSFRRRYNDAVEQGTDVIEAEATRRAVHGIDKPVIYQGQMTFVGIDAKGRTCDPSSPLAVRHVPLTIREPSDTLTIFLLKARRPKKFRENIKIIQRTKLSASVKHDVRPALARVMADPAAWQKAKELAAIADGRISHGHNGVNGNGQNEN